MYLRKLNEKDAEPMLRWMHDQDVVYNLAADFMNMQLDDCLRFIKKANNDESRELHRAICANDDTYLGTVSLKNISLEDHNAEYAIVVCKEAMGTGASRFATIDILRIAFEVLNLHKVYLYVKGKNIRARRFYDKIGFRTEGTFIEHTMGKDGRYDDLIWLAILSQEYEKLKSGWN